MGDAVKWLVRTVGGLVLMLAWWTITGSGDDPNSESADHIPSTVWEGGGGSLAIEVDTSSPAQMRLSFSREGDDGEERELQTWEDVDAGHHVFTIDVPGEVGGYVELGAIDPKPGDELHWTVAVNGETVSEQQDRLDSPLQDGYAFFLQAYFDEYASGTLSGD